MAEEIAVVVNDGDPDNTGYPCALCIRGVTVGRFDEEEAHDLAENINADGVVVSGADREKIARALMDTHQKMHSLGPPDAAAIEQGLVYASAILRALGAAPGVGEAR